MVPRSPSTLRPALLDLRTQSAVVTRRLLPWNNWYYSGLADWLQSTEQGIGNQLTLGGGVGRYLINTDRASVAVYGGAAWQRTDYRQTNLPPSQENLAAALFWAQARLFKFSKTNFTATGRLLPALSDPGRLRINTEAAYQIKVISNLRWNVSFYGNWDNRPPAGFSGSDYGTSSGISWSFGLK